MATVIGVGVKNSTSDLLVTNCDEFIFYDDLVRERRKAPVRRAAAKTAKAQDPVKAAPDAAKGQEPPKARSRRRKTTEVAETAEVVPLATPAPAPDAEGDPPARKSDEQRRDEALDLIVGTVDALMAERGVEEKIWGSMVKQALKRRKPGFNESYYGFRSFNGMLEAAAAAGSLELERDEKSGGYLVRLSVPED